MKDFYQREINYLRLSVTQRCNLSCRYCMPASVKGNIHQQEVMTEEEMITAVKAASDLGIRKVRITGGEPLVKENILSICRRIAETEGIEEVCITTNGVLLSRLAIPLREAGVSRVNISLDTLKKEKYEFLTGSADYERVWEGIGTALQAGFERVKLNVVLMGGFNQEEIRDFANLTRKYPMDVRFIELMPMYEEGELGRGAHIPCSVVTAQVPELLPVKQEEGVAALYGFSDGIGRVGLISPVSDKFCSSCNRLRLTADGKLKPCLHTGEEISVKGMSLEQMRHQMKKAICAKPACHKKLSYDEISEAGRSMSLIGG